MKNIRLRAPDCSGCKHAIYSNQLEFLLSKQPWADKPYHCLICFVWVTRTGVHSNFSARSEELDPLPAWRMQEE